MAPTPPRSELYERTEGSLEVVRAAALGIAEGVEAVAENALTGIKLREAHLLHTGEYEDIEEVMKFYKLEQSSRSGANVTNCKDSVEDHLWRAAIMTRMCQKIVYCLIDQVRSALKDEDGIEEVKWLRKEMRPKLVTFTSEPIEVYTHDVLHLVLAKEHEVEGSAFVLDLTGDQYGLPSWFFTEKEHNEYKWIARYLDKKWTYLRETGIVRDLDKEEPKLAGLKEAVADAFNAERLKWADRQVTWENLHKLSKADRKTLTDEMQEAAKQAVMAYMLS